VACVRRSGKVPGIRFAGIEQIELAGGFTLTRDLLIWQI
jgi:hypothetical protein